MQFLGIKNTYKFQFSGKQEIEDYCTSQKRGRGGEVFLFRLCKEEKFIFHCFRL